MNVVTVEKTAQEHDGLLDGPLFCCRPRLRPALQESHTLEQVPYVGDA
jgi:hypothetical protein